MHQIRPFLVLILCQEVGVRRHEQARRIKCMTSWHSIRNASRRSSRGSRSNVLAHVFSTRHPRRAVSQVLVRRTYRLARYSCATLPLPGVLTTSRGLGDIAFHAVSHCVELGLAEYTKVTTRAVDECMVALSQLSISCAYLQLRNNCILIQHTYVIACNLHRANHQYYV
jgi:hypothetical protein